MWRSGWAYWSPWFFVVSSPLEAARIVNVTVEPKLDEGKQKLINIELLDGPRRGGRRDRGARRAVRREHGAAAAADPLQQSRARSATGQYVAKTTIVQQNQVRLQKATIDVPLDH